MTDPDDELIEKLKELKSRKDALEERLTYLETREDNLKASLLNPIIDSQQSDQGFKHRDEGGPSKSGTRSDNSLQASFITIRDWVNRFERSYADKATNKPLQETLNKAITWASITCPEEEDRELRKLLAKVLVDALNWVKHLETTTEEEYSKKQLIESLEAAVEWTSKSNGDDEEMVQVLANYIIIASNWMKPPTGSDGGMQNESDRDDNETEAPIGGESDEADENEIETTRMELLESLIDILDWVKSINVKRDEKDIQHELLDSLKITAHWVKTGPAPRDREVIKQLLQEVLLIALNWVISVEEDGGEEMKQRLIESLIFAINWATSYETRGDDEVMRTLLRQTLKTAMEWKNKIDGQ